MRWIVFGLVVLAASGPVVAQPPPGLPNPRVTTVFPPGARAGPPPQVTCLGLTLRLANEVTVNGSDLDEPEGLLFSDPRITAEFVPPPPPPPDPQKKDAPPPRPAPTGPHKFRVYVPADVPPGIYQVRFVGRFGVSNPRAFVVGSGLEVVEREPNNDVPEAQRVEPGTTVNGVLANPTDVDYVVFPARKGERVVVACLTSSVDSRATPLVEVYDGAGRRLAAGRNSRDGDAVTDLVIPADGEYLVRVCQFAYQEGGPEYFYRLTVGGGPWVDAVVPSAVEPGRPATVTLYGRNLPGSQPAGVETPDGRPLEKLTAEVMPPADPAALTGLTVRGRVDPALALQDGFEYRFTGATGPANLVPLLFARDPVVVKPEPGGTTPATARSVPAPCEAVGFLGSRGELDWYRFEAKKGESFIIEVLAERVGAAGDFFFSVRDGKDPKRDLSGEQDDDPETLHPFGFFTRTADPPPFRFTAPEDGSYLVVVGCREAGVLWGPRSAYRLRIGRPRPDFRVVALPSSRHFPVGANVWAGGTCAYDLLVHRMDGYAGPVTVAAEGLPAGVTARPVVIGPGARWGTLVLTAASDAPPAVVAFTLRASGPGPDGQSLVRLVRPATVVHGHDTTQQQVAVVARLDSHFVLAVRPHRAFFSLVIDPAAATPRSAGASDPPGPPALVVKPGEKVSVPVRVNWLVPGPQPVTLTAEPLHPNAQASPLAVQVPTQPTPEKPEGVLAVEVRPNAPPGGYSLTVRGTASVAYARPAPPGGPAPKPQTVPAVAFAEPVEVVVLPPALAKVAVVNLPEGTLAAGGTGELIVRVERLHDYAGEFEVRFEPPAGAGGVTADPVAIPAGRNEAKLVLKAAPDAKPGPVANATVGVTARYAGRYPITHQAQVTFTVAPAPKKN